MASAHSTKLHLGQLFGLSLFEINEKILTLQAVIVDAKEDVLLDYLSKADLNIAKAINLYFSNPPSRTSNNHNHNINNTNFNNSDQLFSKHAIISINNHINNISLSPSVTIQNRKKRKRNNGNNNDEQNEYKPLHKRRKLETNTNSSMKEKRDYDNKCQDNDDEDDDIVLVINNESRKDSIWYFKNNGGKYEPTYTELSKIIETMKTGETKTINYKHKTAYHITKISDNECKQKNILTKKIRKLKRNNLIWFYQNDDGSFKPYSHRLSAIIVALKIYSSFQFISENGKKYEVTKLSSNTAKQKNISTGFERGVVCKRKFDRKQISVNNDKYYIDHNRPFIPHLSFQEIYTLKIGDRIDVRYKDGLVYKAKICDMKMKQNKANKWRRYIKVHFDGHDSRYIYDVEINVNLSCNLLSKYRSISERPSHRFKDLKIGDLIDINPIYCDPGWKHGSINKMDSLSGQIGVLFKHSASKKETLYWIHIDNELECAAWNKGKINKKQIEALFFATVSPTEYKIIEIKDISNKDNVNIYESILSGKCKLDKLSNDLEKYLWHGTGRGGDNTLQLILKNGFDRSYNKVGSYGKGTYFARDASYSVDGRFCGKDKDGIYFILLCRVIVGEYIAGNANIKTIPTKQDGTEYESLVNNKENPKIFVSWRDFMAVPMYLVRFQALPRFIHCN